jgi:hypothetical protein
MTIQKSHYTPEEFALRGTQIYQQQVLPTLTAKDDDKIVAIDIETKEFVIEDTTLAAAAQMFDRSPNAQIWFERVGADSVHRFNSVRPAYL